MGKIWGNFGTDPHEIKSGAMFSTISLIISTKVIPFSHKVETISNNMHITVVNKRISNHNINVADSWIQNLLKIEISFKNCFVSIKLIRF